ncbi:MAG: hydrogenase maturation protease [Chloroflexi bacterium]|nr:hydrogenase maturation protease [Chloroflexota bacterium]
MNAVVVGLGNPLRGDDGIGPAVIEWLKQRELPAGVEVMDGGTGGLELIPTLTGRRRALIVDAANLGRAPGKWARLAPIFGVQPARLDWSPGLSVEAEAAVPVVGNAVLNEIWSPHGKDSDH